MVWVGIYALENFSVNFIQCNFWIGKVGTKCTREQGQKIWDDSGFGGITTILAITSRL